MKIFSEKQNKNGFGIVEVIVSVGIIAIGIIPIVMLFNQNLKNEIGNKNILIATYLANESIEIIRQERDDNWSASNGWMENISTDGSKIIVGLNDNDGNRDNIREGWEIIGSNNDRKKIYLANNSYVQHRGSGGGNWNTWGWKKTGFERYLTVNPGTAGCLVVTNPGDCVEIVSHVSFGGTEIVKITAYLYNGWY